LEATTGACAVRAEQSGTVHPVRKTVVEKNTGLPGSKPHLLGLLPSNVLLSTNELADLTGFEDHPSLGLTQALELHPCVDPCDERVVRHGLFFLAKRERFMLECKRKQQMWQQYVVTVGGFLR
jgi:hypothetical protein